jgi:hypothetical protein
MIRYTCKTLLSDPVAGVRLCGEDLTAIVTSYPFDGVIYHYRCPVCRAEHTVERTPHEPEHKA